MIYLRQSRIFANHAEEKSTPNPKFKRRMGVNVTSNNYKSDPILRYLQLATRESWQETKTPDGIGSKFDRQIQHATISHGMSAAPARPFEILLPCHGMRRLGEFCISRILCKIRRKDPICQKIECRCQRIASVRDIAESQHNIQLLISALATAFESNAHEVV
jgi:hypothetical protein